MKAGRQTTGEVVTPPPTANTEPGEIYRIDMTVDSIVPITSYARLLHAVTRVKKDYPQVNIAFVEVEGNKVFIEYYDHPAVPWNLVMIAAIGAIAVIGLVILPGTITSLIRSAKEIVSDPLVFLLFAGGIAVLVLGAGWLVLGQLKRDEGG